MYFKTHTSDAFSAFGPFAVYVNYLLELVCQNQSLNELHYISLETVKKAELVTGIEGVGCWIHFLDSLMPRKMNGDMRPVSYNVTFVVI